MGLGRLLREPRGEVPGPIRRPRRCRAGGGAVQRSGVRWACRAARAHPEGPRLRSRRGGHSQAHARPRQGEAGQLHWHVLRDDGQARRIAPRGRGHHRGHARLHRAAALPRALRRPLHRCWHRRAARGDLGRRHGHGGPAAVLRGVQHVPEPGVRPGQPGLRAAPGPGGVLHRPGRDHRQRRAVASRDPRHGAAHQGFRGWWCWPRRRFRSWSG